MLFRWNKDVNPPNPTNPLDNKTYLVAIRHNDDYLYSMMMWADGWNCRLGFDGEIDRTYEIRGVVAWAEIPEYEEG